MSTSRLFSYYNGYIPPNTDKYGNILVGLTGVSLTDGGLSWFNGPDEDLGYVIAHDGGTNRTYGNNFGPIAGTSVGFWRSVDKTDNSFLNIAANTGQTFSSASNAKTWLESNGHWTSYMGGITSVLVEYFIGGGGGSSGGNGGGGGGAGGVLVGSETLLSGTVLTVSVGSGGSPYSNGSLSSIIGTGLTKISSGGGRGASRDYLPGLTGGSGGGGCASQSPFAAPVGFAGVLGQGNSGGDGTAYTLFSQAAGGGGGGKGSSGTIGFSRQGGNGGNGYLLTWNNTGYAGGGAGSGLNYNNFGGRAGTVQAGYGGGGPQNGTNVGRVNSGGGGGSIANGSGGGDGGGGFAGGSGVVIIRLNTLASSTTGLPTISASGSYTLYTFTGGGTITI